MAISIANNYTNIINHQPDGDDIVWSSKLITGFMSTILVILASELGDKTFVLTTLMAMKHNKQSVFLGNLTAALIMICLTSKTFALLILIQLFYPLDNSLYN